MLKAIVQNWWLFAVRGVAAIVFGVLAFAWPGTTLAVLVLLFGAYALVDGITLLVALARGDTFARSHAWSFGAMGVLGIGIGVVTFFWPSVTALTLLSFVAFWAIAMGVLQMTAAIALRKEIDGEFWLGLGGLVSIAFGILLVVFPGDGLVSLVWLVGAWAIAFGVSSFGVSYRLHEINSVVEHQPA